MKSKKVINRVISIILGLSLILPLVTILPSTPAYAESGVKVFVDEKNVGNGYKKVISDSVITWSYEAWHYSGGYWGGNIPRDIYDYEFEHSGGGVADIGKALVLEKDTFTYPIDNPEVIEAINSGKNVAINLSSGKDGIKLSEMFEITEGRAEDGSILSGDGTARLSPAGDIYEVKIDLKPILNYYSELDLSYSLTFDKPLNKWIPFVKNGFGYNMYSMWKNGDNLGRCIGWVDFANSRSLEGQPEGTIHPDQITDTTGHLQRGLRILLDHEDGNSSWEDISDSNDIRVGWYTFKDAGAVGMHWDFSVAVDIYIEDPNPYPDGKVITSYVKFAGVNDDGSPRYEQIKSSVEPAELNEDGSVSVEDIKQIDEGTAYLNDVFTSPKDIVGNESADIIDWTEPLPATSTETVEPNATEIYSYNFGIRTGLAEYIEPEMIVDEEVVADIKSSVEKVDGLVSSYCSTFDIGQKEVLKKQVLNEYQNLLLKTNFSDKFLLQSIGIPQVTKLQANYIASKAEDIASIENNAVLIEDVNEVLVCDKNNPEELKTGEYNKDAEEKSTVYLRYIVSPERKVRHLIRVYKNGTLVTTEEQTNPLPVVETDTGYEPLVDIPTIPDATFIQWQTSKDIPLSPDLPPSPLKTGTTLDPVNLDTDENLYVEWKKELFVSTEVADNRLLVEQWRLSKYTPSLGFNAQGYMNLNLSSDNGHVSSSLSPSGSYKYKLINPNGQYTDNNYNPSNYAYNNYLHSKTLTQGSYRVTHDSPSVLVDLTGNINLLKGTDTFGIKAAKWLTNDATINGLIAHNIATATTGSSYSGADTVTKTDLLQYGFENSSTYTHKRSIYSHKWVYHRDWSEYVCRCYRQNETRAPKSSLITYLTADYNINSTFDRYIPRITNKYTTGPNVTVENGKTTVSYQIPTELKVYPEVAMLFENDQGDASIKWVVGDIPRTISPIMYHTLTFKAFVNPVSLAGNAVTDSRARAKASQMGYGNLPVAYKGSPLNTTYKISRAENSDNVGILTVKTFALDVTTNKNGVNVKDEWGLSGYNPLQYHNDFVGKWTFKGTATEHLEFVPNSVVQGYSKSQNIALEGVQYNTGSTVTFTHGLIVRGGKVVGVILQNRNNNSYSTVTINDLKTVDSALYEALVNMKLVGDSKDNTVLASFEHQVGHQLTEQKYLDMVNAEKANLDGFSTNNLEMNKGWYSEDTTVLQVNEYVTNYSIPSFSCSDKVPMSIQGLETPIDKNQFFSVMAKGHNYLKLDFASVDIGYGCGSTNVYLEHNSRTGSPFGKAKVDYLVPNVGVTDTTRVN